MIPVHDGMPYLARVVTELLRILDRRDEIIVSLGNSVDESASFLEGVKHENFRVIAGQSTRLSMAEHWEGLSEHARGEWRMFLGQDDCLQEYYSAEVDRLISIAHRQSVRVISARRAFIYWPMDELPGRIEFSPSGRHRIVDCRAASYLGLLGVPNYHSFPQMYTSSLWHCSFVDDVKRQQAGHLILSHPQDASLAASALHFEKRYLHSLLPFSWVGTSKKSAGLAVALTREAPNPQASMSNEDAAGSYLESVRKSQIPYPDWAGPFSLGENTIYFWQARRRLLDFLASTEVSASRRFSLYLALIGVFLRTPSRSRRQKLEALKPMAKINRLGRNGLRIAYVIGSFIGFPAISLLRTSLGVLRRFKKPNFGGDRSGPASRFETLGTELDLTTLNRTAWDIVSRLDRRI